MANYPNHSLMTMLPVLLQTTNAGFSPQLLLFLLLTAPWFCFEGPSSTVTHNLDTAVSQGDPSLACDASHDRKMLPSPPGVTRPPPLVSQSKCLGRLELIYSWLFPFIFPLSFLFSSDFVK